MKRFDFRLEQVLRWRATQADLRRAEASACAKAAAEAGAELERQRAEHAEAARQCAVQSDGASLAAYAGFADRSRRRLERATAQLALTREALAGATAKLVEADRRLRLLEKLKTGRFEEWLRESDRETEAFAAESFLNRR